MHSQLADPDMSVPSKFAWASFILQASRQKWLSWTLGSAVLIVATFAVYWPMTDGEFIWDDGQDVFQNDAVQAINGHGLKDIWWPTSPQKYYYPMTTTTYWLEWKFRANDFGGYHVTNIMMHALASVLLWLVLRKIKIPGAWLAALIFAVHPVNVATVAWITERKNILSLMFVLGSLFCYFKSEDRQGKLFYSLSLFLFLAGLLAKTSIVILPCVLLLLSWWQSGRVNKRTVLRVTPYFILAFAAGVMTTWVEHSMVIAGENVRPEGWFSRMAASAWAVWFYISKAVMPVRLSPIYSRWDVNPTVIAHWIPLLALLTGFVVLWNTKRSWARPCLFAMSYVSIALLPVLGFIDISYMGYSLVADHWQYLAIIGVIALFSAGVATVVQYSSSYARAALATLTSCAVVGIALLAHGRCDDYRDLESWGTAILRENPTCEAAHYNLARVYHQRGELALALEHYERAIETNPLRETAYFEMGGLLAEQGDYKRALEVYRRGADKNPTSARLRYNCGSLLIGTDPEAAMVQYLAVLRHHPDHAAAHNKVGAIMIFNGKPQAALPHHLKAIAGEPENAEFHYNLGAAYLNSGQMEKAKTVFLEAVRLSPSNAESHAALSKIYAYQGDYSRAGEHRRSAMNSSGGDTIRR